MAQRRKRQEPASRLMLVEFFRGALRRNEKSMLFPFLQGLARAHGVETLWLCFGGDIDHRAGAPAGRTLFASLPGKDLAALAGHVARFRPTHLLSDLLCPEAKKLLDRQDPPTNHSLMPQDAESPLGDDIPRCGWFLDWLGVENVSRPGRHFVECAVPDYDAVMANKAAKASTPQITILSGVLCSNRRTVAKNPHFAGLDLSGDTHRGCSFCTCASMPSYTSPRADSLPLIETQFRRIQETAGQSRRDKGRYELFDIHAFRKFDELFAMILRLRIRPAVFLFNPRIDDVLRHRGRIERVLPALAMAGHEIHILSMGVENFSEHENTRFNKDISLAQVDQFLALMDRWKSAYGPVFKPFKAGHDLVELGFILFTPWTALEDIRINLTLASARRFPERGYWLYSVLLIESVALPNESPTPISRLAQRDGLIVDRFPDHGQVYGLSKNEGEMSVLLAWRFKDAKVADYFAVLVRVCASDREGSDCAFFRDDPSFALIDNLYRESSRKTGATPFKIALALLELMEEARPPYSREGLLREAIARTEAIAQPSLGPKLSPECRTNQFRLPSSEKAGRLKISG